MNRIIITLITATLSVFTVSAKSGWTLQQCIEYATNNSISVQQMMLRIENQEISLNTSQNSRLPNLNASLGSSASFGRGQTREGTTVDNTTISSSAGLSTGVNVFNGFRLNRTIEGQKLSIEASKHDLERVRENVALNITGFYLQVMLNKELVDLAESQLKLSMEQLRKSEIRFRNEVAAESEVFDSKALVARDEMSIVQSKNTLSFSLLTLAQALNLEEKGGFDIMTPDVSEIPINSLTASTDQLYSYSLANRPSVLAENLRLQVSKKDLQIAKSSLYPSISMGAGYGTGYYHSFMNGATNKQFFDQLKSNSSENINFNISIPIFNRFSTRNSVRTAQNSIRNQELTIKEVEQSLQKEIEQAHHAAESSFLKYQSASKSYDAAAESFRYEEIKNSPEVSNSTIYQYNEAKTRLERSKSEMLQAKYEYIFNSKILDFYGGKSLDFGRY